MNGIQRARISNLKYAKMIANHKEFLKDMEKRAKAFDDGSNLRRITEKQHIYLAKLAWRYRKQLPCSCVPRSDPAYMSKEQIREEMQSDRFSREHHS